MSDCHMEICIDSIESAKNAIAGGATRLEVCSALSEGGLTPSPGLCKYIKANSTVPIYAMIRMRKGNFVYTREEVDAMLYDLSILQTTGVDGFVFGALNSDGTVDTKTCEEIISAAKPMPVAFHRAFDETNDPFQALEEIINLNFVRILTSGQKNTALDGIQLISELIVKADNRIIIMPGSGILPDNIEQIKRQSNAREFHASANMLVTQAERSTTSIEDGIKCISIVTTCMMITSEALVREMMNIINN